MRTRIPAVLALLLATVALAADFETPPAEPASASLTPDLASGPNFHVTEPVMIDGLMHHYVIDSRWGSFPAYGHDVLRNRVREMLALNQLSKITDVDEVAKAVEHHVQSDAKTVGQVLTNPIGTITGIPRGIGHLFNGYKAQADELSQPSKKPDGSQGSSNVVSDAQANATRYADRYLGVTAAERRYYQQLGLDPYTNNAVLRKTIRHLAKIDAGTNLGMHFVGIPGVPYLGDVQRAMNAIYTEDPAVLRARQRTALAGYGLTPAEVTRFENTLLLSPTLQTLLVAAAKALDGVEGRDELFRHAMSLTTQEEVQVFLQSTGLLVRLNLHKPVMRIVAGLRLPTAQFVDGRVAVLGAFDSVFWTKDVDGYEKELHASLPVDSKAMELWLSGSVSPMARTELTHRGWEVHDNAVAELPEPKPEPKPGQQHKS